MTEVELRSLILVVWLKLATFTARASNLQARNTIIMKLVGRTGGFYDISNSDRLGKSELELVQIVDEVNLLIDMGKQFEKCQGIDHLNPVSYRSGSLSLSLSPFRLHPLSLTHSEIFLAPSCN